MSRYFAIASLIIITALAGSGCRSHRAARGNAAPPDSLTADPSPKKINSVEAFRYDHFAAHAKAVYAGNGQELPLTLSIRMKKDSIIWISVTAVLGIEVARVLITTDSVFVIDKLHRDFIAKDYAYIRERTGTNVRDLSIGMLQSLLLGNNTIRETEIDISDTLEGFNILRSNSKGYENTVYINPANTKIELNWLRDVMKGQELKVNYSDFSREAGQLLPHEILISTRTAKESASATITYERISLEPIANYPFTIPSGYNEIR